jgi:Rab GDP dissociation inhibitor
MEDSYDVIVLGTGLKECIMSGLMSVSKLKVLHIDRNSYYGGESASLNLEDLYKRFRGSEQPPKELGRTRDYCVDLCPKFLMACGDLVKMLLHTKVTRYLEFKSIAGCYVQQKGTIHKVPATPKEALNSGLMGIFQKRRFRDFIQFVSNYKESDPKTHSGLDLNKMTCQACFDYWKLEPGTIQFTGHCIALYPDDSYLKAPAKDMVERCKLYAYSVSRYGNSPFIYPIWGLGGLPEGFSRLCAVHGGVYMLNKPVDEVVYEKGRVVGVKSQGQTAKCKMVLGDPSYFAGTDKVKKTGEVARCICIMSHPIPGTNEESAQIIIPASEAKRNNDIYVSCVSYHHKVAPNKKYIAVINSRVETKEPKKELDAAIKMLGAIDQQFFWVADMYEPTSDGSKDGVYITTSYDPTTHFESATVEAISLYSRMTGNKVDLTISAEPADLEDKSDSAPQQEHTENKASTTTGVDMNELAEADEALKKEETASTDKPQEPKKA